ncbi:glycerol-3-phosphate dehydrogenase [Helicobacter sp. TUL]|uniref:(Fe-S)-binding protein n=1 Tax=Helicobacter sp. TUL TaxID=1848928 RepID=UPI000BAB4013|nr:(Fe-S)-binding protein [Helicobacter sp. TUL]PAV00501.1 glycerol-3-phosphate dehydrogenase [Helicobacter sp. TUL]
MSPFDLQKTAFSCVKCGKCIPDCTIYQVNRDETTSPRGFLDLLGAYKAGHLPLDSTSKKIFETCFLCTTCVTNCPSSLPVDTAIESVRIDIAKEFGISWYKRLYFFLLRHRKIADLVFSFVGFLAPCLFKGDATKIRLPIKRSVFPFAKKSFLQKYGTPMPNTTPHHNTITPQHLESSTAKKRRVAIFIGCLANYNYVNVGESLLKILKALDIEAFVPKFQECCGAPAFFTGDIRTVTTLIKRNIQYFESFWDEIEAMIIPEATCAAMIKVDWKHALELSGEESTWIERLERLLPKIFMTSEWLSAKTDILTRLDDTRQEYAITYHDPCHARKVLGVYKQPRALLAKNFTINEMSDCTRCCGFGGISMQSSNYTLTLKAGIPKAQSIDKSGAQIVSAECGACRMQLTNALDSIKSPVRVLHPLELLADQLPST